MAASDGQDRDALPREATTLEDVGKSAPREERPTTGHDHSAFPINQQQTMIQQTCCQFSKFWRQQVSATVNHDASRDHLGMCMRPPFSWNACYWGMQIVKWMSPLFDIDRLSLLNGSRARALRDNSIQLIPSSFVRYAYIHASSFQHLNALFLAIFALP